MRMKEYEEYKRREAQALLEVDQYNVYDKIINYLEEDGFDINDEKISYLVKMIKKVVFNYRLFGKEFSDNILKNNPLYIFNVFGNNASPKIKNYVYDLLRKNNIEDSLVDFVDDVADNINHTINEEIKSKNHNKKLAYNA